jgi:YidC/Oxa1 family membrane protein insertase
MDRRTQAAVVLIALILGGNLLFTSRYQRQRVAAQRARAAATADSSAALAAPPPVGAVTPAPTPGSPAPASAAARPAESTGSLGPFAAAGDSAAEFVVETPLQRVVISGAGATVRSLELPEFKVYGSGAHVNLIPPTAAATPGRHALGLALRGPGAGWDLAGARFVPEAGAFTERTLKLAAGSGPRTVTFRCDAAGGGALLKRFTFDPDHYDFQLEVAAEAGPGMPAVDSYTLDWSAGMAPTEGSAREDEARFRLTAAVDQQLVRKRATDFRKTESETATGTVRWVCMQSKYFVVSLVPQKPQPGSVDLIGQARTNWIGMRLAQPTPFRSGADAYRVYAGPIEYDRVKSLGVGLEAIVELGWRWIRPISSLLLHFMQFLNTFIPNYGIVILIVSVLAKLAFWPLTERSMRSMRRMQDLQPHMEEIRRRYKDDPKAMNEQVMRLYKDQKVNPVGGCMPILVQTPIFFALFSVLNSNIELRNAPFVGWIDNLAGPDVLFHLPLALPVIGANISLLPLLMGGAMIWQSQLGSTMAPPNPNNPMGQQQFLMKWLMPIMMTFIFYKMPSGLVLYWIVNTLLGIAQQVQINRKFAPATAPGAALKPEGRAADAGSDRGDGPERRGSAAERADRAGRPSR